MADRTLLRLFFIKRSISVFITKPKLGIRTYQPILILERSTQWKRALCFPITVHVDWYSSTSTGFTIISNLISDAVQRILSGKLQHHIALILHIIRIIIKIESIGIRWFQRRITHTDIQRISLIRNRLQITDRGLTALSTIRYLQTRTFGKLIPETNGRWEIEYTSGETVFQYIQYITNGLLWFKINPYVIVIRFLCSADRKINEVIGILILKTVTIQRIRIFCKIFQFLIPVISFTIRVRCTMLITITKLQKVCPR